MLANPPICAAINGQTVAVVVSLFVSLAALAIAAASLWLGALRPAVIEFDQLPGPRADNDGVAGGGINEIPTLYDIQLGFAVTNAGARAALLESVKVENVNAVGAGKFATEAAPPRHEDTTGPSVVEVGVGRVQFPRTIEAGDVRSIEIKFELAGAFRTEAGTQYLETPSREPLARMVADLERVELQIVWRYRRRVGILSGLRESARGGCPVSIPGSTFRRLAVQHWDGSYSELAEIANSRGNS